MSACEQCGRDKLPLINHPQSFQSWIVQPHPGMKIIFHPEGTQKLDRFSKENLQGNLLIGPEGGFDEAEIDLAKQNGFNIVGLGPRILRTETAAVSALTVLQFQFGDMKDRG
jgi:16S rRNA (uracil1498-N3)-methyltransferase